MEIWLTRRRRQVQGDSGATAPDATLISESRTHPAVRIKLSFVRKYVGNYYDAHRHRYVVFREKKTGEEKVAHTWACM